MLTELKRCNSVGDAKGIFFLASILAEKETVSRDEVYNRCSLERGIQINCPGALAFFQFLGFVELTPDYIIPQPALNSIVKAGEKEFIMQTAALSIKTITDEGIFDSATPRFDIKSGKVAIEQSVFPLEYAAIRNFLITVGALEKEADNEVHIEIEFEKEWIEGVKRRKAITLNELQQQLEKQNKQGYEAEEYVLCLEKNRLPQQAGRIKRISDYDVSAGYDIVSFTDGSALKHNRFIEVKSFVGVPHFFWSENERDIARILADSYCLCLVDYSQIHNLEYRPTFIENPYSVLQSSDEWLIAPSAYRVQKVILPE